LSRRLDPARDGSGDQFRIHWSRLRAGTRDVAVVYVEGSDICGSGGCKMYLLEEHGNDFRVRARTTITWLPISKLATRTLGWSDLAVGVGGGGLPAHRVRLQFDGWKYQGNPSLAPALDRHVPEEALITAETPSIPIP
jgi:hypothetical protein